jgi:hypothetical protein
MGFQADDPTDLAEIGKVTKRFFRDEKSGNCTQDWKLHRFVPLCTCGQVLITSRQAMVRGFLHIVAFSLALQN